MKATIDVPDDLYRRVKAKSAMEGRPIRAVVIELLADWLQGRRPWSAATATTGGQQAATSNSVLLHKTITRRITVVVVAALRKN